MCRRVICRPTRPSARRCSRTATRSLSSPKPWRPSPPLSLTTTLRKVTHHIPHVAHLSPPAPAHSGSGDDDSHGTQNPHALMHERVIFVASGMIFDGGSCGRRGSETTRNRAERGAVRHTRRGTGDGTGCGAHPGSVPWLPVAPQPRQLPRCASKEAAAQPQARARPAQVQAQGLGEARRCLGELHALREWEPPRDAGAARPGNADRFLRRSSAAC